MCCDTYDKRWNIEDKMLNLLDSVAKTLSEKSHILFTEPSQSDFILRKVTSIEVILDEES